MTDPSEQVLQAAANGSRVGAMISFSLADEDIRAGARPSANEADWDHRLRGRPHVEREPERHTAYAVCGDPFDTQALDDVRVIFEKPVEASVGGRDKIEDAINRVYERQAGAEQLESDDASAEDEAASDILDSDEEAPVIRWVNSLFLHDRAAVRRRWDARHRRVLGRLLQARPRLDPGRRPAVDRRPEFKVDPYPTGTVDPASPICGRRRSATA